MPRRLLPAALPFVPLVLAACNPRNQSQADYTPSADRTQTAGNDTLGIAGAVLTRDAEKAQVTPLGPVPVTLSGVARWSESGAAELKSFGALTSVHMTLQEGVPGTHYGAAIRRGRCTGPQFYTTGLPTISADSLGTGSSAGDAEVPLQDLLDGHHVIVLSVGDENHACGAIPARVPPSAPPVAARPQPAPQRTAQPESGAAPAPATTPGDTAPAAPRSRA